MKIYRGGNKELEGLETLVHKMVTAGKFWGKDGAITLSKKMHRETKDRDNTSAKFILCWVLYKASEYAGFKQTQGPLWNRITYAYRLYSTTQMAAHASCQLDHALFLANDPMAFMNNGELVAWSEIINQEQLHTKLQCHIAHALARKTLTTDEHVRLKIIGAEATIRRHADKKISAETVDVMFMNVGNLLSNQDVSTDTSIFYLTMQARSLGYVKHFVGAIKTLRNAREIAERFNFQNYIVEINSELARYESLSA